MAYKRKIYHRDENCLNCGYPIIGNYCGECGQKAHLHKDSFWHMIFHFIGDYFHYDNKFWTTIKTMFTKPGLITKEFTAGKRVKYLNPIQLYIFVTTVFFLSVYSINGLRNDADKKEENEIQKPTFKNLSDSLKNISEAEIELGLHSTEGGMKIGLGDWTPKEKNLAEYDSVQNSLPDSLKDGYLKNKMIRKSFTAAENENFGTEYKNALRKNVPKSFFILLPFFALLLYLFYFRHKILYIDHIIFSIHFHSFSFLLILVLILIATIFNNDVLDLSLNLITFFGLTFYLFLSLKKVYRSPWWKTILKLIFIMTIYLISFLIVLLLLLGYSFLTL